MALLNTTTKEKTEQQVWFTDAHPVEWASIVSFIENSAGFISITVQNISLTTQIIETVFDNKPNYILMKFNLNSDNNYKLLSKYDITNTLQVTNKTSTI